jgi:hypothetical protein
MHILALGIAQAGSTDPATPQMAHARARQSRLAAAAI